MTNEKEGFTEETETCFKFPCEFPIKAMGKTCAEFEIAVLEIIHRHVPDLAEDAIKLRPSGKGNYTAITVTIQAQSREQLDAIYMDLTACELVAYAI
jgi:putative lipoic acid-binding regulatory protein